MLTAGILTVRIRRKSDGLEIGGYVVEYPSSDAGVPGVIGSGVNVTKEEVLIITSHPKISLSGDTSSL